MLPFNQEDTHLQLILFLLDPRLNGPELPHVLIQRVRSLVQVVLLLLQAPVRLALGS